MIQDSRPDPFVKDLTPLFLCSRVTPLFVSILRGKEYILPGVAAQDDVVEAARNVQTGFASHGGSIDKWRTLCN